MCRAQGAPCRRSAAGSFSSQQVFSPVKDLLLFLLKLQSNAPQFDTITLKEHLLFKIFYCELEFEGDELQWAYLRIIEVDSLIRVERSET